MNIETLLHQHFADQRVNLVNLRGEYVHASSAQVRDALLEHHVELANTRSTRQPMNPPPPGT